MHDLGGSNVTDAVIAQMASTPDPRPREVMGSLVRHLHAFAGDVPLTRAEWLAAAGFLARVGQAGTPDRREFAPLSDVLGLSDLGEALGDALDPAGGATEAGLPGANGEGTAPPSASGPQIVVFGGVLDDAGRGVAGASVEVPRSRAEEVDAMQGCGAAGGENARQVHGRLGRVLRVPPGAATRPVDRDGRPGGALGERARPAGPPTRAHRFPRLRAGPPGVRHGGRLERGRRRSRRVMRRLRPDRQRRRGRRDRGRRGAAPGPARPALRPPLGAA